MVHDSWWRKPLAIIQPNMQVKDTAKIDPKRLGKQIKDMHANTVVFNVGGIYAWYKSDVPYHHVNEYLPQNGDLLQEMITEFHKQGIRFVARYDFSKADDAVYQRRPEWFVRDANGDPQIIGAGRPGNWSLLMSTCINSGYRHEELAIPVLQESLRRYDIDGIFFNNPNAIPCWCGICRDKYEALYGVPMPEDKAERDRTWGSLCMRGNMERLKDAAKEVRGDIPVLGYYNLFRERLGDRKAGADLLCTEPQDVLSLGHRHIPEFWKPAMSIKLGRSGGDAAPLGIVHSCPGMDWRHTGLPPAEYAFWLAQVPAYGGQIWHSLTGVPDTITDKRILRVVTEHNRRESKLAAEMHQAKSLADVALLWGGVKSAEGWADGLINRQVPFDLVPVEQADLACLKRYRAVIVPEHTGVSSESLAVWRAYAEQGGVMITEGSLDADDKGALSELLGIEARTTLSEQLAASYLRFGDLPDGNPLQAGMEETELIPHRGRVVYCKPKPGTEVLATLVPPFSPLESVGAPPERASLSVERTDIPLALRHVIGAGGLFYLPFSFSWLLDEFKLGEHYRLMDNLIGAAVSGQRLLKVTNVTGLQVTIFSKDNGLLLHFVNGTGRRPLTDAIPLHGIEVALPLSLLPGAVSVKGLLENGELPFQASENELRFTIPRIDIWEAVKIS
ncbi:beta-galactosidase [Paenibacillus sp. CAU 1782]